MAKKKRDQEYEYKHVKVPSGRRAREKALNKAAGDGWELVETTKGWSSDTATFQRRKAQPSRTPTPRVTRPARATPTPSSAPHTHDKARDEYQYKSVRVPATSKADEDRILAREAADGWGVISEDPSGTGPEKTVRLRRKIADGSPKAAGSEFPELQRAERRAKQWAGGLAVFMVVAIIIGVNSCGKDEEDRSSSAFAATEEPVEATTAPSAATTEPVEVTTAPTEATTQAADVTASGLEWSTASIACDHYAEAASPYGYDPHWIMGVIAKRIEGDAWFLKVTADVTNEYGTEREAVVECTVSGTEDSPSVDYFDLY
jgi:Domain of unknown function (DUF4177)